jgi:1-phosphatidylinositol-4-phosphate 5-kinase
MQKKLGEVVYKGHYSWELMIALQLGIRYSVGRPEHMSRPSTALKGSITATSSSRDAPAAPAAAPAAPGTAGGVALVGGGPAGPPLPVPAFSAAVKFAFPSCGSSTTPAHPSKDFKWKDYAPGVFKRLRSAFAVDEAEYMLSLGGSTALRQLNSPGKSGSMFFLSGGW